MDMGQREVNNLRANIIPYGNCVDQKADLFNRLDRGGAQELDIQAGRIACRACPQFNVCDANTDEIASLLSQESTGTTHMVAGTLITKKEVDIRPTVTMDPIAFNLEKLPEEPRLALAFLRRGFRAGKFVTGSHIAKSVTDLADNFIGLVAERDPELHNWLLMPGRLPTRRTRKGICDITAIMFQQRDYAKIQDGMRASYDRYNPNRIDPAWHFEIAYVYAKDMYTLANAGFLNPTRQALAFSPDEYQRIIAQYSGEISPGDLHHVIDSNLLNPEKALRDRLARLHILREEYHDSDIPDSTLRRHASRSSSGEVSRTYTKKPILAADIVEAIYVELDANKGNVAQSDIGTFKDTVASLYRVFGQHRFYPTPSTIGSMAYYPIPTALKKCAQIIKKAEELEGYFDKDEISRGLLRHLCERYPRKSAEDLRITAQVRKLMDRYTAKNRHDKDSNTHVPSWAFRRVVMLYDNREDITQAADHLHNLYLDELLVDGLAEVGMLQSLDYRLGVNNICDPKNGHYITFAPGLRSLLPEQRLALACHTNLGRLLYGQDLDEVDICNRLGVAFLDDYVENELIPQCKRLIEIPSGTDMPPALVHLSADLDVLDGDTRALQVIGPGDTVDTADIKTVVGGHVVRLGAGGVKIHLADHGPEKWLKQTIFERCRPHHRSMSSDIEDALKQGVITISVTESGEYKVAFAKELVEEASEQELAALANTLGIDTFMYGLNVKPVLTSIGIDIGATAQKLAASVAILKYDTRSAEQKKAREKRAILEQQKQLHQLDQALFVLSRSVATNLTAQQRDKFASLLAHHVGRIRELPASAKNLSPAIFNKALEQISLVLSDYSIHTPRQTRDTQAIALTSQIFSTAGNNVAVSLVELLQQQPLKNAQEFHDLRRRIYDVIIAVGRHVAQKTK